jgi:hypothetical protein
VPLESLAGLPQRQLQALVPLLPLLLLLLQGIALPPVAAARSLPLLLLVLLQEQLTSPGPSSQRVSPLLLSSQCSGTCHCCCWWHCWHHCCWRRQQQVWTPLHLPAALLQMELPLLQPLVAGLPAVAAHLVSMAAELL